MDTKIEVNVMPHFEAVLDKCGFEKVYSFTNSETRAATLILHEGAPEKVFTESEVKEMLRKTKTILTFGRTVNVDKSLDKMLDMHGITF